MSTRNKILAALVVIFFVCVVVWVVKTTPTEPPPIERVEPPTVIEYEGNTIVEEQDGKVIWELTCDKMRIDTITQNIELDGVKGKFYQYKDEEDIIWELTAKTGIYYQTSRNIMVEGEVDITNSEESQLLTDKLEWFAEQGLLSAAGNVKVKNKDGAKLAGDKVEWFTGEDKIIATGNVKISKEDMRGFGDLAYADNEFKHFGLMGHARILKGVKDMEEAF